MLGTKVEFRNTKIKPCPQKAHSLVREIEM